MDPSQFSPHAPGSLHFDPDGFWTFHPYPLPPMFRWTDRLVTALSAADRALAAWSVRAAGAPAGFGGLIARVEAAAACRPAGLDTDLADVFDYEAGYRPEEDPPEGPADAAAYAETLEAACRRAGDGGVDLDELEAIHGGLFPREYDDDWPVGEFRRGQTWIGPPGSDPGGSVFVPPPPDVMRDALDSLDKFMRAEGKLPPLVRLALVHAQFEIIHPFYDANGRVGRMLNVLLPGRWGLLDGPAPPMSPYLEQRGERYRELLSRFSRENAVVDWLVFFLEGVVAGVGLAGGLLAALGTMRADYFAQFAAERGAERLQRTIEFALVRPLFNVSQAAAALPAGNFKSTARSVDRLVELGVLEETTGQRRHRVFCAAEWVERLGGF
ncbi:MAG TPA: Fic family protein [Anaerolineales bacterium]|nr:Fic family protein [Anaerolineales bacterium]